MWSSSNRAIPGKRPGAARRPAGLLTICVAASIAAMAIVGARLGRTEASVPMLVLPRETEAAGAAAETAVVATRSLDRPVTVAVLAEWWQRGERQRVCATVAAWARDGRRTWLDHTLLAHVSLWLAAESPTDAVQWLMALPTSAARDAAVARVVVAWADTAPAAAIAWCESLPAGPTREMVTRRGFARWLERDFAGAAEWLAGAASAPDFDQRAWQLVAESDLADHAPHAAVIWAETIRDESARRLALERAFTAWAQADLGAATRYLDESPRLSPVQRRQLREAITAGPQT